MSTPCGNRAANNGERDGGIVHRTRTMYLLAHLLVAYGLSLPQADVIGSSGTAQSIRRHGSGENMEQRENKDEKTTDSMRHIRNTDQRINTFEDRLTARQ